jgi:hypothetical protein
MVARGMVIDAGCGVIQWPVPATANARTAPWRLRLSPAAELEIACGTCGRS